MRAIVAAVLVIEIVLIIEIVLALMIVSLVRVRGMILILVCRRPVCVGLILRMRSWRGRMGLRLWRPVVVRSLLRGNNPRKRGNAG